MAASLEQIMEGLAGLDSAQLAQVRDEAARLLLPEAAPATKIRVSQSWCSYNERRFGKPWIARVTAWPVGDKPALEFGGFMGQPGQAGDTEIMARPGDIIRSGQKDFRGSKTDNDWYVVQPDGSLKAVTQAEARKQWEALQH